MATDPTLTEDLAPIIEDDINLAVVIKPLFALSLRDTKHADPFDHAVQSAESLLSMGVELPLSPPCPPYSPLSPNHDDGTDNGRSDSGDETEDDHSDDDDSAPDPSFIQPQQMPSIITQMLLPITQQQPHIFNQILLNILAQRLCDDFYDNNDNGTFSQETINNHHTDDHRDSAYLVMRTRHSERTRPYPTSLPPSRHRTPVHLEHDYPPSATFLL